MSFVRPEARAALARWREALWGGAVVVLGLWWGFGASGVLSWIGFAALAAGVALTATGVQRARFRGDAGGPGVVQVTEGQIAYFGPRTGGAVAMTELSELALATSAGNRGWILRQPNQPDLEIPLDAEGADRLFDAFASLPGIRTERMLARMREDTADPVVIWRRPSPENALPDAGPHTGS